MNFCLPFYPYSFPHSRVLPKAHQCGTYPHFTVFFTFRFIPVHYSVIIYGTCSNLSNTSLSLSLSLSLSPFSRWTSVSWCLLKQRMKEVVVTTGAISRAKLQSHHHHQQTSTQFFYRPVALPVTQPTVSEHWREIGWYACAVNTRRWVLVRATEKLFQLFLVFKILDFYGCKIFLFAVVIRWIIRRIILDFAICRTKII